MIKEQIDKFWHIFIIKYDAAIRKKWNLAVGYNLGRTGKLHFKKSESGRMTNTKWVHIPVVYKTQNKKINSINDEKSLALITKFNYWVREVK